MTSEQLKQANALEQTVDRMKFVEDFLRGGKMDFLTFTRIRDSESPHRGDTMTMEIDLDSNFVIEKMIEAGIYAAMTVRAAAENDLEKL
jgi:hypothetical protein